MKLKRIVVNASELPIPLEVIGTNGETILYVIKPAGRKFGASLVKPEKDVLKQKAES